MRSFNVSPQLASADHVDLVIRDTIQVGKTLQGPSPRYSFATNVRGAQATDGPDVLFREFCASAGFATSTSFGRRYEMYSPSFIVHVQSIQALSPEREMPPSRQQDSANLIDALVIIFDAQRRVTGVQDIEAIGDRLAAREFIGEPMGLEYVSAERERAVAVRAALGMPTSPQPTSTSVFGLVDVQPEALDGGESVPEVRSREKSVPRSIDWPTTPAATDRQGRLNGHRTPSNVRWHGTGRSQQRFRPLFILPHSLRVGGQNEVNV